ncbi:NAD(P)/FAD-dependent oxidoreductase [Paraburkholderia oxyphila]|uniref:NAD(P)/FAD-dependent oxidoreductase n=1 Tax=Paraburkholderia oxyphila TaxID=614212 RepID=UPI0005BB666E|nr:FAD-dependent oxidoreductase [Paraburkholderia oxyphila]
MTNSVLIVGASVAGVGAANELRRGGFRGEITLMDGQPHLPYDRPPLSKAGLVDPASSGFHFHDAGYYARSDISLLLGVRVQSLDTASRTVKLESGKEFAADAVIIATGARARPFPQEAGAGKVHLLRDFDDALALRSDLSHGKRLAIIGGGFIGAEVASSAVDLGASVVLIEAAGQPFERLLGNNVAGRLAALHSERGIELKCGSAVDRIATAENGERTLFLANGEVVTADVVLAGLGSLPNAEWLNQSALALKNGVICDEHGNTNVHGVYAAGDVAAWLDVRTGVHERHEHWTAAREQGRIVAQRILGTHDSAWSEFVPYFWSDFHGKRVQMLGTSRGATAVEYVFDDNVKKAFVAEYRKDGILVGVVGCNAGARTMRYAGQLAEAVVRPSA